MRMQALYQQASSSQKLDAQQTQSQPTLATVMQSVNLQGSSTEVNEVSLHITAQPLQIVAQPL